MRRTEDVPTIAPAGRSARLLIIFFSIRFWSSMASSSLPSPSPPSSSLSSRPGHVYRRAFTTRQSRFSSRSPTTKMTHPEGSLVGTSLSEWTMQSISLARSEVSRSAVQIAFPPEARVWSGVDLSVSPDECTKCKFENQSVRKEMG